MPVGSRPMEYETVQVQRRGGELRIALDRPEAMNAWNKQFGRDLLAALGGRRRRRRARGRDHRRRPGVLLRRRPQGGLRRRRRTGHPDVVTALTRALPPDHHRDPRACPSPSLAAVNGAGRRASGCSLALACDLIVAARERLLPAGVREHRPGARRRLVAVRPGARRASRARPRWRCSASGSRRARRSSGA